MTGRTEATQQRAQQVSGQAVAAAMTGVLTEQRKARGCRVQRCPLEPKPAARGRPHAGLATRMGFRRRR